MRRVPQSSIKGFRKTGLDILHPRIQWLWDETFPFVDDGTQASLAELGLPNKPLVDLAKKDQKHVNQDDRETTEEKRCTALACSFSKWL